MIYVAFYYYKYFTRVNPLPGPFPFPLFGTFLYTIRFRGNISMFHNYCYEKYGDIYETNNFHRCIVLCRAEYLEIFLSKRTHGMRCPNYKGLKELGLDGKGITHCTIDMVMLTGKRSYSMTAYFNTISDEKSDHQSARQMIYFKTRRKEIEDTLNESLPHDMLTSMIIKNTFRDGNYIETDEANRSMTDSEIRAANMLSFIIYYIAHNPNVKKKMLEEIDTLWAFFVKSARDRDAQFHGTSMHKLPERLDQTKFLTNHQNKYHRIVTKFLAKRKTDQRINRSEKLQDEFDKLDLEYYNPRPRSTIDPATSDDKKNLEIRTNKRLLTHRHIYFQ
ncbi:hypothetical protein RhiirA4_474431 [Rhizophagus irregularis]|uniref:Uncharacterized protein n=1 Tax=Rhizophagus irregularis TaxID=588596 RepID=A0A2I1H8F3_9GLOM|nr:hypothetical protein RhiirA4_474431 [Rhizophagus irregularis]